MFKRSGIFYKEDDSTLIAAERAATLIMSNHGYPAVEEDYSGPGNVREVTDARIDLPLKLVMDVAETVVPVTVTREQTSFPSGGLSVPGGGP